MKKRFAILTIILLAILSLQIAFAETAPALIDLTEVQSTISPLGEASFDIKITNTQPDSDVFMLEIADVAWSVRTSYLPDYTMGIALSAGEERHTKVYIKPDTNIAAPKDYFVELRVRSANTGKYARGVFIIKVDPKVFDYSITIPTVILEPTSIDPAKTNSVKASIKNPYPVYLANLDVEASSKFLNKKATVDIPPYSEKMIDFALNIDSSTPKQEDLVTVVVKQAGKEISSAKQTISIKEFKLPYKIDTTTTKKWLRTIYQITFTNTEGNLKTQDASTLKPKTWAILRTSPSAKTLDFDGTDYLVWTGLSLAPGQTYSVVVMEDARPIAFGLVLILLLIILYYQVRSPIIVHKKGYALHKKDTGNNEMKIVLHVKNRSGRMLEKVRVLDRLPLIHKVDPDFGEGTPEPRFRKHGSEGVILDWDIALAAYEERIFVYKVKSALPIVGEYELKPCVVQYGKKNRRTSSPSYRLTID